MDTRKYQTRSKLLIAEGRDLEVAVGLGGATAAERRWSGSPTHRRRRPPLRHTPPASPRADKRAFSSARINQLSRRKKSREEKRIEEENVGR